MTIITVMKDFLIGFIESVGYPGVFVAMLIESCLIPLPSEVTMPLAGALAASGGMNIHIASLTGAFGNLAGSLLAYLLGYKLSEKGIVSFIKRWGKWILLSEHEYFKAKGWLQKYGNAVSFFSRLLPGVRTVISLPAGVARIKLVPFIVYTFVGSVIWSYLLAYVGYELGQNWEEIEPFFHKFQIVIVALFLILAGLYVYKKLSERKKNHEV